MLKGGEPADLKNYRPITDFQYLPKSFRRGDNVYNIYKSSLSQSRAEPHLDVRGRNNYGRIGLLLTSYLELVKKKKKSFKLCLAVWIDSNYFETHCEDKRPEIIGQWGHHLIVCRCFSSSLAGTVFQKPLIPCQDRAMEGSYSDFLSICSMPP